MMGAAALRAVLEGQQREAVGVFEIPLLAGECEEEHRSDDEHQAHENLQRHDFHSGLLGDSAATVTAIVVIELRGMSTAHASGDIFPASAKPTVRAL